MITRTGRQGSSRATDAVIIGAGHCGLAMSRCLAELGIGHVVLERGEVANAWRHERWDSLRLLTPNWQSRLPGYAYTGNDPDGFMTMAEVIRFIDRYARVIAAPVLPGIAVTSVFRSGNFYRVETSQGCWRCRAVVIATGAFSVPVVPAASREIPPEIAQLTTRNYRNPGSLPAGNVLVVGGSASGLQLAEEIRRSGRDVTLAVGEHVPMPRTYRGRDIQWWLDALGVLDERYDEIDDIQRARRVPSPQLAGSPERNRLDLNRLQSLGVKVTGRLMGVCNGKAQFSGSLANICALADLKLGRLLARIDNWALENSMTGDIPAPERFAPTRVDGSPLLALDLAKSGIRSVVWATGLRPDYSWLRVPVVDSKGTLRHQGGVVDAPGLYAMGLPFMRRRKSSYIHGAEDDARELSAHLATYLASTRPCTVAVA